MIQMTSSSYSSDPPFARTLQSKSLHNNVVWALLGNIVFAATHWGMIALLARIATPAHVGHLALSLAICGPIFMFSNLQLRALLASDAGSEFHFKDYLGLTLLMSPIGLGVIACVISVGGFGAEASLTILLMGIAKNIESFSNLCYGALQQVRRLDLVGKSLIFKGPGTLLVLGLSVWTTQSIALGIVGMVFVWLVLFVTFDGKNVAELKSACISLLSSNGWDFAKIRKLFKLGLPLAVSAFLLTLTTSVPNILIGRLLDESSVGIFAALASLSWAGVPVINALGQALLPRLGECYIIGDSRRMRRLVFGTSLTGLALGVAGIFGAWGLGDAIVTSIYGADYMGQGDLLIWLMGAACLLYTARFFGDALTAMRCARTLLVVQSLTVTMVVVGGYWAIPVAGLQGMAQVLVFSLSVRAFLLLAFFWLITSQRFSATDLNGPGVGLAQPESRAA